MQCVKCFSPNIEVVPPILLHRSAHKGAEVLQFIGVSFKLIYFFYLFSNEHYNIYKIESDEAMNHILLDIVSIFREYFNTKCRYFPKKSVLCIGIGILTFRLFISVFPELYLKCYYLNVHTWYRKHMANTTRNFQPKAFCSYQLYQKCVNLVCMKRDMFFA